MKKRLLSALLFTAALSLPAAAQTLPAQPAPEGSGTRPAPRTSAAEIDDANDAASPEEVSKKITRFEKILAALPKFSGYAQIGYTYQTNVGGTDGKNSSSFNVKRMRLILTGDISRTFDYKMQFEGFSSSADQQGKALITVQDMYLRAKIRPQIHIWAGQFPVPLTIENYDISPGTLEVPNFSHAILKMVCRNAVSGYNTYRRDCGLQATGAFLHRDGLGAANDANWTYTQTYRDYRTDPDSPLDPMGVVISPMLDDYQHARYVRLRIHASYTNKTYNPTFRGWCIAELNVWGNNELLE